MKINNFFKHEYLFIWRYISSFFILLITLPIIFINGLFGETGRYIGLVGYIVISILGIYEVLKNFNISKISAFYLSLLTIVVFIINLNSNLEQVWHLIKTIEKDDKLSSLISTQFGWNILIIFMLSFVPLFVEKKWTTNFKEVFLQQILIILVLMIISIATKTLWIINSYQYIWVFYFLSICIISDTFSYIGGKYFNKYIFKGKKLAPSLSPNKTWGGFWIGYVFCALFVGLAGYFLNVFQQTSNPILILVLLTFILPIVSSFGDLSFSGIKRYLKIKDFSNIIKGHGGIMDRLDSISLVMFFMMFVFLFHYNI